MKARALLLLLFLFSSIARGETITSEEFEKLAEELAGKVTLFRDAWKIDPKAEFYGGTTRDYLYWLKKQFRNAHQRKQVDAVIASLRAAPSIDVREFIVGDSDVDIFSDRYFEIDAKAYGVRKIDPIEPTRLSPDSALGKDEVKQGFIPAEKIRLGQKGFIEDPRFGDGVGDIFSGKLSVSFSSEADFAADSHGRAWVELAQIDSWPEDFESLALKNIGRWNEGRKGDSVSAGEGAWVALLTRNKWSEDAYLRQLKELTESSRYQKLDPRAHDYYFKLNRINSAEKLFLAELSSRSVPESFWTEVGKLTKNGEQWPLVAKVAEAVGDYPEHWNERLIETLNADPRFNGQSVLRILNVKDSWPEDIWHLMPKLKAARRGLISFSPG